MCSRNAQLDCLFDEWPGHDSPDFSRDGIINEPLFEGPLFVMAEPSGRGVRYSPPNGCDLLCVYRRQPPIKPLARNVALWTEVLLDRRDRYETLGANRIRANLRRAAISSLKKLSGAGKADYPEMERYARDHRLWIEQQIRIIAPSTIVACGSQVHRVLLGVLAGASLLEYVVVSYHPSVRTPDQARTASARLLEQVPHRKALRAT
jgi:hypothetical protein